jgi:glucose 1-dehydrogenase
MTGRLRSRIAIVTGSDVRIGQAMAEAFAHEGADVAVTYLKDREGAEEMPMGGSGRAARRRRTA